MEGPEAFATGPLRARTLVADISDPSARGIADHVATLIVQGRIPDGTRLPTVRAVAAALHVGATTVATAWALLKDRRLIRADGRNGTFVRNLGDLATESHLLHQPTARSTTALDLVNPSYDIDLVPDPAPHLAAATHTLAWHRGETADVDEALAEAVGATWPFTPQALALAWSFSDAFTQVLALALAPGDRVLVESACSPETAAVLAAHRLQVVRIPCDAAGMLPDAVERAMTVRPSLAVVQPRMADPLAHAVTARRAHDLASVLVDRDVLLVEEDASVGLAPHAAASLGAWLPDRTVLVRDYQRAYGPRMRMAVIGGAEAIVDRLRARQEVLGSFPSLLGQRVLASMLGDPDVAAIVARARTRYASRWHALSDALARHGITVPGTVGLTAWVRVEDSTETVRRLAHVGVRVGPGIDVAGQEQGRGYVRVATSGLRFDPHGMARLLVSETATLAG